ncbi:MAG: glycosyltransferase family 87 protein [Pseudorhizobium sp.]
MAHPWPSTTAEQAASIVVLALAVVSLVAIGVGGFMKAAPPGDDFWVFYQAGSLFRSGVDPWLALMTTPQPFSYPPHALSFLLFYDVLPPTTAFVVHSGVNVGAIAAICYCANHWFLGIRSWRSLTFPQAAALALIIGNPYTATSVYQGQTTLPVTAALMLSWLCITKGHRTAAGLLLAVATVKPQLSLLYVLWLMMSAQLTVLIVAGLAAIVLIVPAFLVLGPWATVHSWWLSLSSYGHVPINMPGSPYVVGLESLLVAHGFDPGAWPIAALGLLLTMAVFCLRQRLDAFMTLQFLLVLTCTFLFVHDYDYVAIILVWSCALHLVLSQMTWGRIASFSVLFLLFFMPQRLIRDIDLPLIVHARTLILVAMFVLLLTWRSQQPRSGTAGWLRRDVRTPI